MLPEHADVLAEIEADWAAVGLTGSFLARNLDSGIELGFGTATNWALASVIKLPIALACYDAFDSGELDPARQFELDPAQATRGPTGTSLFLHGATVAAEDLLQLSLAVSDNAATDTLLNLVGLDWVNHRLGELGATGIVLRHSMRAIYGVAGSLSALGPGIATAGGTPGGGHLIEELDPNRANAASARALIDLLHRVWRDEISTPAACARLRTALGRQLIMHRLASELAGDEVRISAKTGTFADLRHEVGVVESAGSQIAVATLTRSSVPASIQLEAEYAIGHAARLAVDALRS